MKTPRPNVASVLTGACRRALQWRLSLLWLLAQALPLSLISLPLWTALSSQLDRSRLARHAVEDFDASVYIEALLKLSKDISPASLSGGLVLIPLLPWLGGALLTAAGSAESLGFAALTRGGLTQYWRMTRLWSWALVPLGLVGMGGGRLVRLASERAAKLPLEAEAERVTLGSLALAGGLFLLAQATLDATRALLVLEPTRRSVVLAWGRASVRLLRRFRPLFLYAVLTATGLSAVALLGYARLRVPAIGALGLTSAFLLGQAMTLVLIWMRFARLFALVALGQRHPSEPVAQSAGAAPEAHDQTVTNEATLRHEDVSSQQLAPSITDPGD